jgi:hypothetical protein
MLRRRAMRTLPVVFSLASLVIGLVVFVFAEGARAVYSGLFFVVLAAVLLVNALRGERRAPD